MSEEQIAEALGAGNEELPDNVEQLIDNQQEGQPDLSPAEQKAWDDGWRPEDQFDGKAENWKTAGEYNLYGEMQTQVRDAKAETRRAQSDMDSRIASLNKLHSAQQAAAINDLKAQQRQAVEEADTVKYDQLQTQIENTAVVEPVAPQIDPTIADWNAANPWIDDGSDKASQAQMFFSQAAAKPGATTQSALAFVNDQISKLYPEQQQQTNPRRESATMTEQSLQPRQRQRAGKELSMNDLTAQESREYELFGKSMFKDEKQFLKSVADARKS
jgi:hypothetical protein